MYLAIEYMVYAFTANLYKVQDTKNIDHKFDIDLGPVNATCPDMFGKTGRSWLGGNESDIGIYEFITRS